MWAVDRENFPDPGEGMWWAVQTATTIGYGDVVPTTAAGRAVASLVMILGVAFVSILTAFIVSDLVARHAERQQKEIEQEARHHRGDRAAGRAARPHRGRARRRSYSGAAKPEHM